MTASYILKDVLVKKGSFTLEIDECTLEQGKVYSVVGSNGAGKSSFLDVLAFLEGPAAGELSYRGQAVESAVGQVSLRRQVGYAMQNPYLFSMTVEHNIEYGLRVRGVRSDEIHGRVGKLMERMDLAHLAKRHACELSGGEAQRVALARTLVLETDVILLDEPTAAVDASNVATVEKTVLDLCRERNATLVLSTHSAEQAARMSPNLLTIEDGKIHNAGRGRA